MTSDLRDITASLWQDHQQALAYPPLNTHTGTVNAKHNNNKKLKLLHFR